MGTRGEQAQRQYIVRHKSQDNIVSSTAYSANIPQIVARSTSTQTKKGTNPPDGASASSEVSPGRDFSRSSHGASNGYGLSGSVDSLLDAQQEKSRLRRNKSFSEAVKWEEEELDLI